MDGSKGSRCSALPQRVITGIMGFLGVVVSFLMRACLSVAITEMVVPPNVTTTGNHSFMCQENEIATEKTTILHTSGTRYNWSQEQQGWILSAFFVGYVITHIPGALIAQRFGGKWSFSLGILANTICTLATPLATEYGDYKALIAIRIMMGLASGTLFPSLSVLIAAWVPEKERGKLASFVFGGGQIGSLVSFYCSGLMLSYWSWHTLFYFWGVVAFIWFVVFSLICYKDPASHPFISKEELMYLENELGQLKRHKHLRATPWTDIITSFPIIILIIAQILNDFVFYVLASDLPKYMKEVLGFPVGDVGLYSSLPYFLMWVVSIVSGFICDHMITRKYLTVTQARRTFAGIGSVFTAICIVAASYAGCNKLMVVMWFTIAMGFMGLYFPSLRVNLLDLSPNYAGSIMALSNGIAAFSGIVAPTFVGMMTPDSSLEQWRLVFWAVFGVSMFRTVIYSMWASGEVQPWNNPIQSFELQNLNKNSDQYKPVDTDIVKN